MTQATIRPVVDTLTGRSAVVALSFIVFAAPIGVVGQTGEMRVRKWSVARQLLVLQTLLLVVVLAAAATTSFVLTRQHEESAAREKVLVLAQSVADNPFVIRQVVTTNPTAALEPYAERIRTETRVDFVVIMARIASGSPTRTHRRSAARSSVTSTRPFSGAT